MGGRGGTSDNVGQSMVDGESQRTSSRTDFQIPELESQGLLRRMSPVDRLDNIMLRCEVEYEEVKSLAKELKITLDEYLYEATL